MQDAFTPRFEAMTAGMVLDRAMRLYARNFPLLVGIIALAYIPYYILLGFLTWVGQANPDDVGLVALALLGFSMLMMVLWLLVLPLSTGATSFAVSEKYLQRPVTIFSAYSLAFKRFWPVLGSQLLVGLAVAAGTIACIVPGIFLWLCWSVVVPVVMLEQQGPFDSMRRSWDLTEGFRLKILGVAAVVVILSYALIFGTSMVVTFALTMSGNSNILMTQIATQGVTAGATLLTAPLFSVVLVLLYYDLRIRKEGFDLVLLNQSLHGEDPDLSYQPPTSTLGLP